MWKNLLLCLPIALLASCASDLADLEDGADPAAGYGGLQYEKDVLAGRVARNPGYLAPKRYRYVAPDIDVPDFTPSFVSYDNGPGYGGRRSFGGGSSLGSTWGSSGSGRSSYSSPPPLRTPSTIYSSDYRTSTTLGGNKRVSDRWGNSVTYSQGLDGRTRATTGGGVTYSGERTLGGAYRISGTNGRTYTEHQTLGGTTQWKGNDGYTYKKEKTLGGGYRYSRF